MLVSMTGFATKTITLSDGQGAQTQIALSLKSLNSRYFETTCKLPYPLAHLETDLIKLFKKKLHRGHLIFLVQSSNPNFLKTSIKPDIGSVKSYLAAIQTIKKECAIAGELTVHELILLPSTLNAEEETVDKQTQKNVLKAIGELIESLTKTRLVEGKALRQDLLKRIHIMNENIENIAQQAEKLMQKKKEEIAKKLATFKGQPEEFVDAQRASLYLELDKMDLHEEIVRFKSHLTTFKKTIESQEQEKGRRLDFILQELTRETNTIAAKCGDALISSHAINIKVEVEKSREQVQNVV